MADQRHLNQDGDAEMAELRKRLEQQHNQARGEADDLKRELARSLGRPLYDAINRVLDQVLGAAATTAQARGC